MSPQTARIAVAFVCALGAAAASCGSDVVPAAANGVSETPPPPSLVVLRSGKVVEGTIRFAQGGYEVVSPGGRTFLADSMVWFSARHRRDAYDQLRRRAPARTADDHVGLARWCIENKLHACAEDELSVALEQEPDHAEARATLVTLDKLLRGGSAQPRPANFADPTLRDPHAPLGGLSSAVARDYVTRVQPLLVNRCGNGACHGGGGTEFSLRIVRPGHHQFQALTAENLEAVRRQIDSDDPATSPLLAEAAREGHGGLRKPLFLGPSGQAQLKTLEAWVARAAKTPLPKPSEREDALLPPSVQLTGATEPAAALEPIAPAEAREAKKSDPTRDLLRKVLADERPDAFDPDEFNRTYGPRAGQPTPSNGGSTR